MDKTYQWILAKRKHSNRSHHGQNIQKVMVQPINLIFRYLQNRTWIECCVIGFDEYMNLVLGDTEEIHSKTMSRKQLDQIMLKRDNITLLQNVSN
uniref:small nuclear ribonucleoprotein E-like n=1 Tax=Jaculus jaculus TaxID=51337 RepID=UPI001E1B1FE3|nr:small nuclear ribonucleoprotein E-like [Jaculus jaculus]